MTMYGRRPPPPPPPAAAPNAVAEMLERDGELDRILSGRGLSFDPVPAVKPAPPRELQVEPPPWLDQPVPADLETTRPIQPGDALAEIKARSEAVYDPPPPWGPAVMTRPPATADIPPPDWEEEAAAQAAARAAARDLRAHAQVQQAIELLEGEGFTIASPETETRSMLRSDTDARGNTWYCPTCRERWGIGPNNQLQRAPRVLLSRPGHRGGQSPA